jgi:hypothetical protein
MLGKGINAARIPLIDMLNVGGATNNNFVDGDFKQSAGLQGNGTTKYLDSLIKPSQLGTSNNGGLGHWETNVSYTANVEAMGTYNTAGTNRYVLDLRSNRRSFRWGLPGNEAMDSSAAANGHYYGQRVNATSRSIYYSATLINTNITSDATSGASDHNIYIVGSWSGSNTPWPGRCGLAYFTNGTLTTDEISDFHAVLQQYLMGPTGKA